MILLKSRLYIYLIYRVKVVRFLGFFHQHKNNVEMYSIIMKLWKRLRRSEKLLVLRLLDSVDIDILVDILITKETSTNVLISIIGESNLLTKLSYNTVFKLSNIIIVLLEKNRRFNHSCLIKLKKLCGADYVLLFLFIITLFAFGDTFFNRSKLVERILPLINHFHSTGSFIDKVHKLLYTFIKYEYINKGYSTEKSPFNHHYIIYKITFKFIRVLGVVHNIVTVRRTVQELSSTINFISTRAQHEIVVNRTKVFINAPYVKFLLDNVFSSFESYLKVTSMNSITAQK